MRRTKSEFAAGLVLNAEPPIATQCIPSPISATSSKEAIKEGVDTLVDLCSPGSATIVVIVT